MAMLVKPFLIIGLLATMTGAVTTPPGWAAEPERKTRSKVAPQYPDAARRMQLAGTVRLTALVSADGRVTSTEVTGGHPILVAAVKDAVMRWKFQAAKQGSREVLVFSFAPD
jgi:TonB family protein